MEFYRGITVSKGIGIGKVFRIREQRCEYKKITELGSSEEQTRYRRAAEEFAARTCVMVQELRNRIGTYEGQIIEAQLSIVSDLSFIQEIENHINSGATAEAAVTETCDRYVKMMESLDSDLMNQRAADIRDVKERLLDILTRKEEIDLSRLQEDSVIVADEITPSIMLRFTGRGVAAIITGKGGYTSHASIMARAMGIPAIAGMAGIIDEFTDGRTLIVDGDIGNVYLDAPEDVIRRYTEDIRKAKEYQQALNAYCSRKTLTADGIQVNLYANIGNFDEAGQVVACGGEGVGLFRTEFMFIGRDTMPDEEEQYEELVKIVETLDGRELIVRTLDLGEDKGSKYIDQYKDDAEKSFCQSKPGEDIADELLYLRRPESGSPYSSRGIRLWLSHEELYRPQLRAILRAAVHGPVKVMLPMISEPEEVYRVRKLIKDLGASLDREKIQWKEPPLGVMIETGSACQIADLLAQEVDFFSIGTNDLVKYIMSEDRLNKPVHSICAPQVLHAIKKVIEAAHSAGIPVGMCGEAAAEPHIIPLWIAWGLDTYSVNPVSILPVRETISKWTKAEAENIADTVIKLNSEGDIRLLLYDHQR